MRELYQRINQSVSLSFGLSVVYGTARSWWRQCLSFTCRGSGNYGEVWVWGGGGAGGKEGSGVGKNSRRRKEGKESRERGRDDN